VARGAAPLTPRQPRRLQVMELVKSGMTMDDALAQAEKIAQQEEMERVSSTTAPLAMAAPLYA
jgi:hypothetical protein